MSTSPSRYWLFKTLRKHRTLSEKRSIAWEQNKTAKYFIYILSGFTILYLIFLSIPLALIANKSESLTACELMYGISPFLLLFDFLMRFIMQQTPAQIVKPYCLLPLPKYACIDTFIGTSMLSSGNLVWFAMFIPYAIMSVVFSEGIMVTLAFLLGFYIAIVINSLWYMCIRTLINDRLYWWIIPVVVYGITALPWLTKDITHMLDTYGGWGDKLCHWHPLPWVVLLSILCVMVLINRRLQYKYVKRELNRQEKTQLKTVSQLGWFDRFGQTGEYLKLEIKSVMRNKNIRKSFIFATLIVLLFSLLVSFTDIYSGDFMTLFWCNYNYAIYGAMLLIKVMCYEGNYIDGLMVRKENILSLLHAKYYFYVILLIVPFLLMLPTIFTGKSSLLMHVALVAFTGGIQYCIFMQMAVYNKQSMPLNTKFIGKGTMENNYLQVVAVMGSMIVPVLLIKLLDITLGAPWSYVVLLLLGVAFVVFHALWLKNIYRRMMARRYVNMEGFRSSRQ